MEEQFQKFLEEKIRPKELLLIEDDRDTVDLFIHYANKYNCNLSIAPDGNEGIRKANDSKFDVIFLDLNLPCMPGEEVFRSIKSKCPKVLVAIISGYLTTEIIQRIHQIGFTVFIIKPANYNEDFFESLFGIFGIKKLPTV